MKPTVILSLLILLATPAAAQDRDRAINILRDVAQRCPRAYANAHRGENTHPEAWDFVILGTQELKRQLGPLYGMNGKRGNPNDPSSDALAFGSGRNVRIVDFIVGAGEQGNDPNRITWNDVTEQSTVGGVVMGVYIDPDSRQPVVPCGANPPPPGPTAGWESKHNELLLKLGQPSGDRDPAYVRRVAEQFAFSFPGEGWGHKSADPSRPPSGDVIARQTSSGLTGYRIVPPALNPTPISLAGQTFIPVAPVNHIDAPPPGTGNPPPPEPPPPTTPPPATPDLQALTAAIAALRSAVEQLHTKADALATNYFALREVVDRLEGTVQGFGDSVLPALERLESKPLPISFPTYAGELRILGSRVPVTLRPQP